MMNEIHTTIRAIDPLLEKADRVLADKQYNHMEEKLEHMVDTMNLIKELEDHAKNLVNLTRNIMVQYDSDLIVLLIEHINNINSLMMVLNDQKTNIVICA